MDWLGGNCWVTVKVISKAVTGSGGGGTGQQCCGELQAKTEVCWAELQRNWVRPDWHGSLESEE